MPYETKRKNKEKENERNRSYEYSDLQERERGTERKSHSSLFYMKEIEYNQSCIHIYTCIYFCFVYVIENK